MAKPSDEQQRALAGLLGLGNHSARKSHYPELAARLDELEAERNRYWRFNRRRAGWRGGCVLSVTVWPTITIITPTTSIKINTNTNMAASPSSSP
jgi:hypothetical protein